MGKTAIDPALSPGGMPALQKALDRESYEWLAANVPDVLTALETEMKNGRTPRETRLFVLREYGREELAARIEQAARHIASGVVR